jgi:hypothetical protein
MRISAKLRGVLEDTSPADLVPRAGAAARTVVAT